ncbi:Protein of unknown function [Cotesia congregata]|uniref:Uncharacterized protein n=1 Tax=Cotesia congregata TaxID=51543 RepID=A0A8J2MH68_COTCN|nr:Protein of unknown function [Cotesia congregata]
MKKLITLMLVQNIVIDGQIQVLPKDGLDLFNDMMRYLFDNCRTEFGTIGFWGTERIFLADDEVDFVLLNDNEVFERLPTRKIKFLVKIYKELNLSRPVINLSAALPTPEIETVFVFDKSGYRPVIANDEFEWYQRRFQNSKVYYCFEWDGQIGIIALNSFANVAPVFWKGVMKHIRTLILIIVSYSGHSVVTGGTFDSGIPSIISSNYVTETYTIDQIVTHNRGLATPLEKMFEFYGWLIPVATLIILLIVLVVIYPSSSVNDSKLSFAAFECLRLLIGNSIYTRMDTDKIRIFFSVIFFYFLAIQTTFSGQLAAFLTKPVYRKNVETLVDLEDPRYAKIYADESLYNYIELTPLYNNTLFGVNKCEEYIEDPSVACIDQQNYLTPLIATYNLHTPKKFVKLSYSTL